MFALGAKSHRFKSYSLDFADTLNVCYAIRIWLIIIEMPFVWLIFFIMSSMEWMPWKKNIGVNNHESVG